MYQGKNRSTEYSKGNKTITEKVATTRTEDGHKWTKGHGMTKEEVEGPTSS